MKNAIYSRHEFHAEETSPRTRNEVAVIKNKEEQSQRESIDVDRKLLMIYASIMYDIGSYYYKI